MEIAIAGTHQGRTNKDIVTAPPVIITVDSHLVLRVTTPPLRQSMIIGPIFGWVSSQFDNRVELRVAAQAASSTNGTVGSTGRNAPITPKARLVTASARNSQRTGFDNGRACARGGSAEGADMPLLCRPAMLAA